MSKNISDQPTAVKPIQAARDRAHGQAPPTLEAFFTAFFPSLDDRYLEIRKLPSGQQHFCTTVDEAVAACRDEQQNIYFGVCSRDSRQGKEEHAACIPALWVDMDVQDFDGDEAAIQQHIDAFELTPSVILHSGTGRHCYWLFKQPEVIVPEDRPQYRGLLLGLAMTLGGDRACRDLSRIMRVPGTWHLKHDGKTVLRAHCPLPRPVRILRWTPDQRYTPADFEPYFVEDQPQTAAVIGPKALQGTLPETFLRQLTEDEDLQAAWEGKRRPPTDSSRSGFDAMLAGMLAFRGFEDEAIATILRHYAHGKSNAATLPYLSRTIGTARQLVQAKSPPKKSTGKEDAREAQAVALVRLASQQATFFHDETATPYAYLSIENHRQIWNLGSRNFRRWLSRLLFEDQGKAPSGEAITTALNVLEAKAVFEGEQHPLYVRAAWQGDALYYDLTDPTWRAVRITAAGWSILPKPPVLFKRFTHQAAQVEPIPGGDLRRVFDFISVRAESDRLLLLVWLVAAFIPGVPHVVPILHGPQGSGKSSTFRTLRRLIDPSILETLTFPRDLNTLIQNLSHHWAPLFDNVTTLSPWLSDALCRAVTGEGFSKRQLYTDDEDQIYHFQRVIGLNGINIVATRADLLDRSILIGLERIPPTQRRTEAAMKAAFDQARPQILGGIFDTLVTAVQLKPNVTLEGLPRMADFATWGCAIAQALGYDDTAFMQAYEGNRRAQNAEVLDGHPVAAAIMSLMEDQQAWDGEPSELLKQLESIAERERIDTRAKGWPGAAHVLTRRLKEVRSNLQEAGIDLEERRTGKKRGIRLKRLENSVTSVTSVTQMDNSLENNSIPRDVCGDASKDAMAVSSPETKVASPVACRSKSIENSSKRLPSDANDANDATIQNNRMVTNLRTIEI